MTELKIALQKKQKLFRDSIDRYPITLFGGARGGGKSYALRNIFLLRMIERPKSSGAIFRKTYSELEANHIRPLFQEFPVLREFWSESKKILTLPSPINSTLQFSHCANETDVFLYQGREISDLGIDEAGQWTEAMFRTLLGSNRSSNPNIPARCALTANPGNIGHTWLKRIFIERRFNDRERPEDYNFIQSLVSDNAALIDSDPDYVHRLNTEPNEALRRAYLYGDWDVAAGQFFNELRRDIHFIKPFEIPRYWNRFGAYDFGYNHPGAFGWFANDEDGNTYLYREFVKAGLRVDKWAEYINTFEDTKELQYIKAGHDCWAKRTNMIKSDQPQPPTIAEEFQSHGLMLTPAILDRVAGASQLRSYLALRDSVSGVKKPRLYIFDRCPITYETISRMIFDPNKVEDVLKQDAVEGDVNSGDDAYDMIRYAMMSRPMVTDPIQSKIVVGSQAWHKKKNENLFEQALEHFKKEEEAKNGGWPSEPNFPNF